MSGSQTYGAESVEYERERKYGTILRALNAKPRRGNLILWERSDKGLSEDNVEGRWEEKI